MFRLLTVGLISLTFFPLLAKGEIYIAGTYQNWDPVNGTVMSDLGGGLFEVTLTGLTAGEQHEFKILDDEGGSKGWGNAEWTADDNWFTVDSSGGVTISLNTNVGTTGQNNANVGISSLGWTPQLVGNFMTEAGGAGNWNPSDPTFNMISVGTSLWESSLTVATAGTYEVKITDGSGWLRQFGADGYWANPSSFFFTTSAANEQVIFSFNSQTPGLSITSVPEPGSASLIACLAGFGIANRRKRKS